MADDTRDPSNAQNLPGIAIPSAATTHGNSSSSDTQQYISDTPRAQQQLPPKPPSIYEMFDQSVRTIQLEDFKKVALIPCFRESMLTSIGTGFAFGGIRLVMRATIWNACAWSAWIFLGTSIFTYETCRLKRGAEKDSMMKVMHAMVEKKKRDEEAKRARRAKAKAIFEENERLRREAEVRWYKPWTWNPDTTAKKVTDVEVKSNGEPKA